MTRRLIFSCIRNEAPFLLEWVAYHRAIGFSDVLLISNDCEDGSDAMADRLQEMGLVQHIRNANYEKRGPQWTALKRAEVVEAVRASDWAMHLDLDEFLQISKGSGRLDDLTDADADAISIPWRFFGNAGVDALSDTLVTETFTRTSPYPLRFPRQAMMFKTLYRPSDRLPQPGVHAPRPSDGAKLRWMNGDLRPVSGNFSPKRPLLTGPDAGNSAAQINHYALKSRESFLVKSARGLPNHREVAVDLGYWVARNFNAVEDRGLAGQVDAFRDAITKLREDAELDRLHREAHAGHRAKAAEIIATEAGLALYTGISMATGSTPPTGAETARLYAAYNAVYARPK